jgi:hypothetical protein
MRARTIAVIIAAIPDNFKNKIEKITGRGLLFDIIPFIKTVNPA